MPELPEVETIVRRLINGTGDVPSIIGCNVASAQVFWPRTLAEPDIDTFLFDIQDEKIEGVSRRAKYLVFSLPDHALLLHLRMSGDLRLEPVRLNQSIYEPLHQHDRMSIQFTNGWQLIFNDPRKFGRAWLVKDKETVLGKLGPEPFDPGLSPDIFFKHLKPKNRQLKPLLLDQSFLAGLGNIYTDEALYRARLHPQRAASSLTQLESDELLGAIRQVLLEAIRCNGASIDWAYRGGSFQNRFHVYHRTGEPCARCGTLIQRKVIGQRSAHYCPVCQPLQGMG